GVRQPEGVGGGVGVGGGECPGQRPRALRREERLQTLARRQLHQLPPELGELAFVQVQLRGIAIGAHDSESKRVESSASQISSMPRRSVELTPWTASLGSASCSAICARRGLRRAFARRSSFVAATSRRAPVRSWRYPSTWTSSAVGPTSASMMLTIACSPFRFSRKVVIIPSHSSRSLRETFAKP